MELHRVEDIAPTRTVLFMKGYNPKYHAFCGKIEESFQYSYLILVDINVFSVFSLLTLFYLS